MYICVISWIMCKQSSVTQCPSTCKINTFSDIMQLQRGFLFTFCFRM